MGQQQLLLLVLATVIVGLAAVAGIQAFDENRQQAAQDAIVQRAADIGTDVLSVVTRPSSMGGMEPTTDKGEEILRRAGYETGKGVDTSADPRDCKSGPEYTTSVPGAGSCSECRVMTSSSSTTVNGVKVEAEQVGVWCRAPKAERDVVVVVDPASDASDPLKTEFAVSTLGE